MSCENCINLKIGRFNYSELVKKWDELYYPNEITPGYKNRMFKDSLRSGVPFERTFSRYVYCAQGMLNRFYIVRANGVIRPKADMKDCHYYQ